MLYGLVVFVHIIICLILIAVILLQAGRGGGLSEIFAADSTRTIFGTKANVFLARATVFAASMFLVISLLLGIMTSRRGKSLIELKGKKIVPEEIPYLPVEAVKDEEKPKEPEKAGQSSTKMKNESTSRVKSKD